MKLTKSPDILKSVRLTSENPARGRSDGAFGAYSDTLAQMTVCTPGFSQADAVLRRFHGFERGAEASFARASPRTGAPWVTSTRSG